MLGGRRGTEVEGGTVGKTLRQGHCGEYNMKKEDRAVRWAKLLELEPNAPASPDLQAFVQRAKPTSPPRLQQDCLSLQRKHHFFQEADLRNSMELMLCYYLQTEKAVYVTGMHEVAAPFFLLGCQRFANVYACFAAFVKKMAPPVFHRDASAQIACRCVHKLLLYHDPALCSSLDARMQVPGQFAEKWLQTLFAGCIDFPLLVSFWELCLKEDSVVLPLFLAVVLVQQHRDQLLSRRKEGPIAVEIASLEQLSPLCQEAVGLQHRTPKSFVQEIEGILKGNSAALARLDTYLVLTTSSEDVQIAHVGTFVIDFRSSQDYQCGHYPCSYNLSRDLRLSYDVYRGLRSYGQCSQASPPISSAPLARPVTSHS